MSTNSSWVPNEDAQALFTERSWLQGVIVSAVAYGATIPLYFLSLHLLVVKKSRGELKTQWPLLAYIVVSFLLGTLFMVALAAFTQMAFIDDRNYPGGPDAFENNMFSIPLDDAGNGAFVLSNLFSDAIVVWRFIVIYRSCRASLWVTMALPCLMLAGSAAMGIMFFIQVSTTNPYASHGVNFSLPYFSVSFALNATLTIAIVLRLLMFRYRIVSALGPKYGTQYTSIAAMIIESAAFYSAVSVTLLVLFALGNPVSEVFIQSLNQFQTIATLLIVFRVAQGKGWTEDTATRVIPALTSEAGGMVFALGEVSTTIAATSGNMGKSVSERSEGGVRSTHTLGVEIASEHRTPSVVSDSQYLLPHSLGP